MHFNAKFRLLVASAMLLAATQAQATLTSYTANGKDVVYSSVSDVTWTKDASLLDSMFASQGYNTVVNNILAVSPTISNIPNILSPTGNYTLTEGDFGRFGVSWFGAMAFINYLNNINYAGSNQWRLPTVTDTGVPGLDFGFNGTDYGYNTYTNGTAAGNELSELYYQELGSKGDYDTNGNRQFDSGIKNTTTFDNDRGNNYWSGIEYAPNASNAWTFATYDGSQAAWIKNLKYLVWAVSPGQISAVPEPESVALLLAGVGLVAGVMRRRRGCALDDV